MEAAHEERDEDLMLISVQSRWGAIKMAWRLFWFATGTSVVGIRRVEDGLEFVGKELIADELKEHM